MSILLKDFKTPFNSIPFDRIKKKDIINALEQATINSKSIIEKIRNNKNPNFETVIEELEKIFELPTRIHNVFNFMISVKSSNEFESISSYVSKQLNNLYSNIIFDKTLFSKVKYINDNKSTLELNKIQLNLLDIHYKRFIRKGTQLTHNQKSKVEQIYNKLDVLCNLFLKNNEKKINNCQLIIKNEEDLEGLPEELIKTAYKKAVDQGIEKSWIITIDNFTYRLFMENARKRSLRERLYRYKNAISFSSFSKAKTNNGDNIGNTNNIDNAGNTDNTKIILKIIKLRSELASIFEKETYTDYILEDRSMVKDAKFVNNFLKKLLKITMPVVKNESGELLSLAKLDGIDKLEAWDYLYYTNKHKNKTLEITDEIIMPYFEVKNVVNGIFLLINKLFGLIFKEIHKNYGLSYHDDVVVYKVTESNGKYLGLLYLDLFSRENKLTEYKHILLTSNKKDDGGYVNHSVIIGNFKKHNDNKDNNDNDKNIKLLRLDEVKNLLHEFGHSLQCLFSNSKYLSVNGSNPMDFEEIPSTFFEFWFNDRDFLKPFAKHYKTGEPIPEELLLKLNKYHSFHKSFELLNLIELSMLDMAWHQLKLSEYPNISNSYELEEFENKITEQTRIFPLVERTCRSVSFNHIFNYGYSARFYSYIWSEVLALGIYKIFKRSNGQYQDTGTKFKKYLFSNINMDDPMKVYQSFLGKQQTINDVIDLIWAN